MEGGHRLSILDKRRRHLYQSIIEYVTPMLTEHFLLKSHEKYMAARQKYPFVNIKKLVPGSKGDIILDDIMALHNKGLIIFTEQSLPRDQNALKHQKYIKFKRKHRLVKDNLSEDLLVDERFTDGFEMPMTYLGNDAFEDTLNELIKHDFGLLIQPDSRITKRDRYALTHYRVKIDWPEDDAVESLAKHLGYVEKSLHEKSEQGADRLERRLFEYYSFHHTVGGRRRAAICAAQYLKEHGFYFTTFVASQESRTLTRITNKFTDKYLLLQPTKKQVALLEKHYPEFRKHFLYDDICVFNVVYRTNRFSRPPEQDQPKLRDLSDHRWLNIRDELLLPKRKFVDVKPLRFRLIYGRQNPFE